MGGRRLIDGDRVEVTTEPAVREARCWGPVVLEIAVTIRDGEEPPEMSSR
jgi:hypothetical protein